MARTARRMLYWYSNDRAVAATLGTFLGVGTTEKGGQFAPNDPAQLQNFQDWLVDVVTFAEGGFASFGYSEAWLMKGDSLQQRKTLDDWVQTYNSNECSRMRTMGAFCGEPGLRDGHGRGHELSGPGLDGGPGSVVVLDGQCDDAERRERVVPEEEEVLRCWASKGALGCPSITRMSLFTIPIPALGTAYPGGAITCTTPAPKVYLLTFVSPPDNRLTTPVLKALLSALDVLEFGGHAPGVVVTTSGIQKFYSNGLDLAHAAETDGYWPLLYAVWARFLTYPMPTVAWMNGHAFAGGLMLATSHDYRLAPSPRGFLCLNELLFGAPLKPAMAAIFRHKLPSATYRTLVLEAKRFNADEALAAGIVDGVATGLDDVLGFIAQRELAEKPKSGVYGILKGEMYKDLLQMLSGPGLEAEEARFDADQARNAERREFGRVWYEQWEKEDKAKL
ncbi:uncharacterized protein J7T54_005300 [Emericellopsis cladophorae]|uniref:Uncharacterized protein n=1 Tax=Emericellopsis cladophorae TaxID=2686198 RepID=A0A9P9Y283_9HYPO|nr:uncharacterized protein J7T54_005300 [Emericellopsis cladophorae]KAI6781589.1 hypothetical protein J7T54_005300 [Emericellopsis cladophorae]